MLSYFSRTRVFTFYHVVKSKAPDMREVDNRGRIINLVYGQWNIHKQVLHILANLQSRSSRGSKDILFSVIWDLLWLNSRVLLVKYLGLQVLFCFWTAMCVFELVQLLCGIGPLGLIDLHIRRGMSVLLLLVLCLLAIMVSIIISILFPQRECNEFNTVNTTTGV